jgi:hypothetical protein
MLEHGRYPTPDEIQVLMDRAHLMRSEYIAALMVHAALRAKQFFVRARERRITSAPRYFPDVG